MLEALAAAQQAPAPQQATEAASQTSARLISDELNIDIGPDGKVYGIELLNANEQLGTPRMKNLIIENRGSGQKVELALAV